MSSVVFIILSKAFCSRKLLSALKAHEYKKILRLGIFKFKRNRLGPFPTRVTGLKATFPSL